MIKNFKSWIIAAAIRAIKTFAQTFISLIPMSATFLGEVNWEITLSSAALAAVLSLMTSVAGLPEVTANEVVSDDYDETDEGE